MSGSPMLGIDRVLVTVLGAVLVALVLVPLAFIVAAGLGLIGDDSFLRPAVKFLQDPELPRILVNTFSLAVVVTLASVVTGVALAIGVERTAMAFPTLGHRLILVPILVSPLVGTVAWVTLARPGTGFVNVFWRAVTGSTDPLFSIYSFAGVALVISLHVAPYVYVNVRAALRNVDGAMEEAAAILGASASYSWRRVTIPLVRPAILSSAVLVFVLTLETFSVVALLGGPAGFVNLPFSIYLAINLPPGDWNYAAFEGLALVFVTGLLMFAYWRIVGPTSQYASVGGKGHRVATRAGGGLAAALTVIVWGYLAVAVVLPIAALVVQSFLRFSTSRIDNMAFTVLHWQKVIEAPSFQLALVNTAIVGAAAATLAVLIAIAVAHLSVFERMRSLDGLAGLPLAYPGIVLGMAMIFTLSGTPVYGTLAILVLAYATQFLPFAIRALSGPVMQLDRGMDEAGKVLGASALRRIASITTPIVRRAVFGAWLLAFTRGIRELNVSIFLYTPATIVLPVLIWNLMEQGAFSQAAALSLMQIIAMSVFIAAAELLDRRLEAV